MVTDVDTETNTVSTRSFASAAFISAARNLPSSQYSNRSVGTSLTANNERYAARSQTSDGVQPDAHLRFSQYASSVDTRRSETNDVQLQSQQSTLLSQNLESTDTILQLIAEKACICTINLVNLAWEEYRWQESANKHHLKIIAYTKEISCVNATDAALEDLEHESTLEHKKIQDLINAAVAKATKPLHSKLKSMADKRSLKTLSQKNSVPRGRTAPSVNKKATKDTGKSSPNKNAKRNASQGGRRNGLKAVTPNSTKKRSYSQNKSSNATSPSKSKRQRRR